MVVIARDKASTFWCSLVVSACGSFSPILLAYLVTGSPIDHTARAPQSISNNSWVKATPRALWLEQYLLSGFPRPPQEIGRPRRIAEIR